MTVSVVIPHYGAEELLTACLAALRQHTSMPIEVVVVDNGTGQRIDADIVIANPDNRGFAAACNQGAAAAAGEQIVFLNNDTEPRALWLEPLVAHLERGAGIVGSLLLYPDGTVQHAGVRLFHDPRGVLTAENRKGEFAQGLVDAVTGACLAVTRELFFAVGGFDELFRNGYEDVDLCLKVRRAGQPIVFDPASVVTHHESASGPERWTHVQQNIRRLQDKWNGARIR